MLLACNFSPDCVLQPQKQDKAKFLQTCISKSFQSILLPGTFKNDRPGDVCYC